MRFCARAKNVRLVPVSMKAYGCTYIAHLLVVPEENPSCSSCHHGWCLVNAGLSLHAWEIW